ncbi:TOG array regulator of axonemal microtubules protein 1 isoform X2 [Numida meleagris]|uniref:TOG array regulator of axonemal microtubules protein 1 isoform X2 n=1 Tax=Numida meleagris TaxID=8996 RepID=UPI000B3E3D0E|nr:TOG array regulator of axonemal microtubules protein 1 isoform X2 [Numida meleagris]
MAAALGPAPPPPPARAMERPPGPELGAAGDGPERPRGRRRGGPLPGEPARSLAWQPGGPEEPEGGGGPAERPGLGLLPAELRGRLLDQEDYRSRTRAVEELQRVLGALSPAAVASAPSPALLGLLGLLCALLDDANFAVVLGALEAAQLLALRLGGRLRAFLGPLVAAVAKGLGDPRAALRQRCHRLLLRLMEAAGPRRVLGLLLRREHLRHRNARVREEVIAACIAALLTYPSRELDLGQLAFGLAPALVDGKRRVRHAALEAFALLASAMGPGKSGLLFEAVDAVELEDNGDGVMHAVQARLARKILPRLGEHGLVEYAVPLPSCGQGCGVPRGADTEWLLAGSRTQSAQSCGSHLGDAVQNSGSPGVTTRRVLSAGKGKNKLPWEAERGGDGEGGTGDVVPFAKGVEQLSSPGDFLHSPKLQPSQGVPGSDEIFFSRRRPSRNLFQNSIDFNSEHSPLCAGAVGSHQPHISGKCGTLGYTQTRGKSGSVDSALQFLGLNNCQQDKVCASLNFSGKTQRSVCSQAEHTSSSQGAAPSQGAFILPSYPLASPGSSPKHLSSPADSPKQSQENTMSFSNSWPLKSFEGLHKPTSQKPRDSTGENMQEKHSPLQLKPTLVRHPASRRGLTGSRPVPPIPRLGSPQPGRAQGRAEQCEDTWMSEAGRKLAADLSELKVDDEEVDREEMQSSLRSLRNSAAKKRAKLSSNFAELDSPDSALKLDLSADSPSHASSPSSCSESGVYSQESLTSPVSTVPQRRRVMSDTFPLLGSKAQPARISSARSRDANVAEHNSSAGSSDVSVVGQRLHCGNGCGDDEDKKQREAPRTLPKSQNMEEQGNLKHSKVSACSFQQLSSPGFIAPGVPAEDAVVIVGKGVFGSPPPAQAHSQTITCVENGDDQSVQQEPEPSPGFRGISIKHGSASQFHVENEREIKVTMSKSAQDKMRQKKKERKEQSHKEYQEVKDLDEKEKSPWERLNLNEPENTTTDKLNLSGDILAPSRSVSLSLENVAPKPSLRRTSSLKKTKCSALLDSDEISLGPRGRYKDRTPSVTHSPEVMDPSELEPFAKPEVALTEALALLADDDWEKKIEGLNFVRCLSAYHAAVLTVKLHETSLAVAQEVKNLRSGVSRAAVVCLGDLFTYLKKSMDQELDNTVKVLLHKAGESNTFIREEVDKALKAMVNNVTPARALCSLINGGQSHLHTAVRRCTAQHMSDIVERMGPEWILCGTKGVTDRTFPAIARFALDSSQQTRYYGRKMLFCMMTHPDFDKTLEKYVPAKDLPYIKEFVNNLRQKGLGEMPLDTPSAKGRRSHTGSVGHSRSSSTSRDALNITDRETTEAREVSRKPVPRNSLESEEYVKDIVGLLNAKDFRDRINGIKQLLSDTENNQDFVVVNIVKIFDAFKSRLHDSNSKVNQVALETMHKMIPLLKDNLSPVINMLVPAMVDNNLNSKNPGIYAAATDVIQALCQHLDSYLLLQPFCTKVQFLNGKAKQDITEKLADLVVELYPRKPHAVEQKVLVVLWHLLGTMTNSGSLPGAGGNIRAATAKLSKALFAQMGPSLLTHAAAQPPHIKRSLEEFLEIGT